MVRVIGGSLLHVADKSRASTLRDANRSKLVSFASLIFITFNITVIHTCSLIVPVYGKNNYSITHAVK